MFTKRARAAILAVLGISLLLTGCAGDSSRLGDAAAPATAESPSDGPTTESGDGQARTAPDPALQEFYDQTLSWSPCQGDFECADLTVPIDYQDPTGDTIDLALLRRPADSERPLGSLVVNPGGPGAPGTTYASQAEQAFRQPLLDNYDIVGFDPRGTGESSPVDCLSDAELDDYLAADPSPDTTQEQEALIDWSSKLGKGCVANSGEIAGHVTTFEAARDMDVLRAALDDDQLDYFGASYGTKLGASYAELFPDRVGRFVLDGAVDVSASSHEVNLQQGKGFETALRAYVQDCVDGGDCYLGKDVDEGLGTITGFLEDLDAKPIDSGDPERPLTEGRGLTGIILPLYASEYWFLLDDALKAGLEGDGSQLSFLADTYSSRNTDGSFADNSSEALWAINCLDDPWSVGRQEVLKSVPEFERASPTLGRAFAWFDASCAGIDAKSSEEPREIDGSGAAPIVVTGTTRDPATPFEWAQALSKQLDSGVLIERDGDGHTAYNADNECVDEAIEGYLIDGTVPEDGLRC